MAIRERIRKIKHLQNKNLICVLERPADIKNIASAIRNISAFGVEKLYVVGGPKIVHSFETSRKNKRLKSLSAGANKWVYIKHFDTTQECIDHLKKNRFTIVVTSSHEKGKENIILYEGDFAQKRLAVWFGSEAHGISGEVVDAADMCVQIPMGGVVESLNLGTSTGVALAFISYQRLKFVYSHKKVRFRPRGMEKIKMKNWEGFFDMEQK